MKKILLYIFCSALLSGFTSCSKWLELKPQDGIVGDDFWNTKEQVQAAVTGLYASMLGSTAGDRALPEYFFIWGEARADMVSPGFRASQDELDMVNLNMLPTNGLTNWRSFYQTINYSNTIIELAPGVLQKDQTFSEAQLKPAVAQARAVRALMYFYLVRTFGDVPLKLTATISDQDIAPLPKTGKDSVLNQILIDLKAAETDVPLRYGSPEISKGRFTKYAVNALLADVYLWMDKYQECAQECDKIINSNSFGLVTRENYFNSLFLQGSSNETIFELQYDAQKLGPFYNIHTPSQRRWGAAIHLTEDVYGVDAVNATPILDIRGENTSYRGTDFSIWKYVGADNQGIAFRPLEENYANWIFYRYADVLLMKAEAINQLEQPLEASRIVKVIRDRANAIEMQTMDSTNKDAMTLFILEERQREFAFEGKRWFDVLRHAKRDNYQRRVLLKTMASISMAPERLQSAFAKLDDNNSHYMPINFYEIQTNKLLEQNPFYNK